MIITRLLSGHYTELRQYTFKSSALLICTCVISGRVQASRRFTRQVHEDTGRIPEHVWFDVSVLHVCPL